MLRIFFTGVAMGAADVVPGVSGGTIAFISGIYQRLLDAIRAAPAALMILFQEGITEAWRKMDANFLLVLAAGILLSVASLARLISWVLVHYPTCLWGFFFGLILASFVYLALQVRWNPLPLILLVLGAAAAILVGEIRPGTVEPTPLIIFGSGALAICAMILPGISGSFILLVLGMYPAVLAAIKNFDLIFIALFAAGCGLGLLGFSHILGYLLHRFRDPVLSLLTGFLAGSLLMVWPWQRALDSYVKDDGTTVVLQAENVLPATYALETQQDPYTLMVIGLAILGVVCVFLLSRLGTPQPDNHH